MMTTGRRAPRRRGNRRGFSRGSFNRRGFTLVELVVAVMFLTFGLLALAGTSAVLARQMQGGNLQALAAGAAQTRFERMRSLPCGQIVNGSATTRGVTEVWVRTDTLRGVIVTDTVKYNLRYKADATNAPKAYTYRTVIPCV